MFILQAKICVQFCVVEVLTRSAASGHGEHQCINQNTSSYAKRNHRTKMTKVASKASGVRGYMVSRRRT